MIEIQNNSTERAILVALQTSRTSKSIAEEHISELEELADTAGANTIFKIIQSKSSTDPAFYIGKGKAEELATLVELNDINLAIFDDDLTPVQVKNLEKLFNRKIVDRSGLILDIFASRAKTKEAKTQVELAQLQYLLPRLTRAWTHLSKQYGGIGTKGPGETQIETDRRMIRNRISHLKEKLKKIESSRETQSKGRKDFLRIALAGYTNAGKSTLFNLLTKADAFAEDKLFATLDSTTREVNLHSQKKILISDTVGFIRKLPPHLVASFKSTLNEVREADIILHLIDISHEFYEDHIKIVDETLNEFGRNEKIEIKVFNKVDEVEDKSRIDYVSHHYPGSVVLSALKGINIKSLVEKITNIIENSFVEETVDLELDDSKIAAKIHELADVISVNYNDDKMNIAYKTSKENSEKIRKMIIKSTT